MVFYKIEAERYESLIDDDKLSRKEREAIRKEIAEKTESLYQKDNGQSIIFTAGIREKEATFAAVGNAAENVTAQFEKYKKLLPFEIKSYRMEEVTFSVFEPLLHSADHNDYLCDADEILYRFKIENLCVHRNSCNYGEAIVDDRVSVDECKAVAKATLFTDTLIPEIDRIYSGSAKTKFVGHPVHYIFTVDDRDVRKRVYKTLLSALYNNNRITNKRYSFFDFSSESRFPDETFDAVYRASKGGTVVIRYTSGDEAEGQFSKRGADIIAALCDVASKYKNDVLTIICIPKAANKIKEEFFVGFGKTALIELSEGLAYNETAVDFLKLKAREYKIRTDKKLVSKIEEDKRYTPTQLNTIFDEWYSNKLRNDVYPQYKTAETVKMKIKKEQPRGTAYEKLEKLVGLKNAKEVIKTALNYFKAQKLFADRGIAPDRPSMHMIFTGNPGTAKTTVARLFAEIMKDNGLLEHGEIYEVGRADLVGKYVGHTAPLVKSAFKRARGGVLFIDEAYSLVDDRDGLFGDEAINTIVQEMENNRKDTIVIFAGYPDKMEAFMSKNPGLRSRIAFHIPFDDYSSDELCEIAQIIASDKKLTLGDDAIEKLKTVFEQARQNDEFGNGRYVRNVIEKAKMALMSRLVQMDIDSVSDDNLTLILAEDIEPPKENKEKLIKIGFSA